MANGLIFSKCEQIELFPSSYIHPSTTFHPLYVLTNYYAHIQSPVAGKVGIQYLAKGHFRLEDQLIKHPKGG